MIEQREIPQFLRQHEIAEALGVSRQRIQHLEYRALRKLRAAIKAEAELAGVSVREWLFGE